MADSRARRVRAEIPLFALVFGTYAYFYQAGGWNQNSRFDLTRAVVERGTLSIDGLEENTGDKARHGGHWYTDKAPGLSFLAVPAYAVTHRVWPGELVAGSYAGTLLAVGLPSAWGAVHLFALGQGLGLCASWSAGITLAYALGTLALPYSTILHGHQTAAALGLSAFSLVGRRRRPLLAGVLLGSAVAVDYSAALLAVIVAAYAVARLGARGAAILAAGAMPPLAALACYHAAAFGHPLTLPYAFALQDHRRTGWFMGIGAPDPGVAWALLVGSYRGLFYAAPWLVAGLPGLAVLYRRGHRAEAVTCSAAVLGYFALNAGLVDWHGGWAMGPRYLIPALPFLAVGAMGLVFAWPAGSAARRGLAFACATAAVFSFAMMLVGTAVRPDVPLTIRRPYRDYLFPAFAHGRLSRSNHPIDGEGIAGRRAAWNLGHQLGLEGLVTLGPLAAWLALTGWWLRRVVVSDRPTGTGIHADGIPPPAPTGMR